MTNNIEQPKPSNKKLWLILAGISITVIGSTLAGVSISTQQQNRTPDEINQSQSPSTVEGKTPMIESVQTSTKDQQLTFSIKVKDVDTTKWSIEYQVADQDRTVKAKGKEHDANFDASVKLSNSAYYRIKVRGVDDEGKTTEWSENHTVKLSELEGFKTVNPDPAYYQTGWAKGTNVTLEAAKEGIQTAWHAQEIERTQAVSSCMPINSGEMTPKLLLPPVPSVMPKEVTLKYMTTGWNGSAISITYLWCS
jgi:hypothetical protein